MKLATRSAEILEISRHFVAKTFDFGCFNPNLLEFFPMLFYVRGGSDNPLLEESICNQEHFFKYWPSSALVECSPPILEVLGSNPGANKIFFFSFLQNQISPLF